ncbi:class I SAM-dependent methyltransferase [Candidatus Gracilibacteria bacterium]|jgi:ubiquinone/menaquinone biosynthesis C-methylase UbiE|nr:class I SAM-dependent methyltransferase [Candidatus Gracilibacteria bacterium]
MPLPETLPETPQVQTPESTTEAPSDVDAITQEKRNNALLSIIDETALTPEELSALFLQVRGQFQRANSPEEIQHLYERTLAQFPIRYRFSTQDYAQQGVPDILQRRLWFEQVIPQGNVIDVGCADGYFALELASPIRKMTGVDMLEKRVAKANRVAEENRTNATFIKGFAEEIPFTDETFDAAILSHMLEHVHDPARVLEEVVRVTKTGGKLIAVVPHEIGRDPTHIRYIPSTQLRDMLAEYGEVSPEYIVGTKGIGYVIKIKI